MDVQRRSCEMTLGVWDLPAAGSGSVVFYSGNEFMFNQVCLTVSSSCWASSSGSRRRPAVALRTRGVVLHMEGGMLDLATSRSSLSPAADWTQTLFYCQLPTVSMLNELLAATVSIAAMETDNCHWITAILRFCSLFVFFLLDDIRDDDIIRKCSFLIN